MNLALAYIFRIAAIVFLVIGDMGTTFFMLILAVISQLDYVIEKEDE